MKKQTIDSWIRGPVSWFLLIVTLSLLIWQAHQPQWRGHMQVDISAFQSRANHFISNGTWGGMEYNEYQPGALWFFVFIGSLIPAIDNFDSYLGMAWVVNALLIVGHYLFFRRFGPKYSDLVLLLLAAASGPILLFRFELLVGLLTLLAWQCGVSGRPRTAGAFLGLAISIKLYPVILLPLLLVSLMRKKEWNAAFETFLWCMAALVLPFIAVIAYGGSIADLIQSLRVHGLKPIGLEGFWGHFITIAQHTAGIPLERQTAYGVHGLVSALPVLHDPLLNLIWMLPTGAVLVLAYMKRKGALLLSPVTAYLALFAFVYFSKVVNPQYLWWFMVFLPLLPLTGKTWWKTAIILVAAALSLIFTQIFFPIHYSQFLDWYNGNEGASAVYFHFAVARNVLLLVLMGFGVWEFARLVRRKS